MLAISLMLRPSSIASSSAQLQAEDDSVDQVHGDSMLGAIRPALLMARIFGVLPVPGIGDESKLKDFSWCTFRSIYSIVIFVSTFLEAILSIARLGVIGVTFQGVVNAVFFCYTCAAIYIFLRLAISWKSTYQCWNYVEHTVMGSYGWPSQLGRRTLIMTILILSLGAIEFILSLVTSVGDIWLCTRRHGIDNLLKKFFLVRFAMAFYVTNYSLWKGLILFFLHLVAAFTWNFVDLVIILISMSLSARFKQLNDLIFSCKGKERPVEFWRRTRETYFTLSELTRETDQRFGTLVLMSFAGNLFFICLQLMHSVSTKSTSVYYNIYFVFSVILLVVRTFLVGIVAAEIYEESKRPKEVLYSVPSDNYNVEVDRFLKQVCSDQVAMTGRNFFAVTRSLLLTVAGTIITYEIILVQYPDHGDANADDAALVGANSSYLFCRH